MFAPSEFGSIKFPHVVVGCTIVCIVREAIPPLDAHVVSKTMHVDVGYGE